MVAAKEACPADPITTLFASIFVSRAKIPKLE